MNTKRNIISEVEQMAVNAIVSQPDEKSAAEKHFSETAKKIVETAMQAIDIMEIGDICRRAVTGASIQDYDLLAKLLTDKDFDHERLAKAIEARASEKPIDFPTFYTPGWLCELAKKMEANGGAGRAGNVSGAPRAPEATDAELHEAATEEPTDKVKVEGEGEQRKATSTVHLNSSPSPVFSTLPSGADGTPPAEDDQHPEMRPVRPQTLDDIGMTMDKRVSRDANGEVVRIDFAGIRHLNGTRPYQLWGICVSKNDTGNDGTASHISVFRDHEIVFSGTAFFGLEAAADVAISMMIRKIIGNTAKRYRDHFRRIRKPTAMTKAAKSGEVA